MWLILQQDVPDDYVLATGETHSVREFIELAFACTDRHIQWRGSGVDEVGIDARTGKELVTVDPRYFRPTEVDLLQGDPSKARAKLGWHHRIAFPTWCARWSKQISPTRDATGATDTAGGRDDDIVSGGKAGVGRGAPRHGGERADGADSPT